MKKLKADDLMSLKYGDKVWRFFDGQCEGFRFVAIMPSNKRYLIFEHGENLIFLYVADRGVFRGDWYGGEYDSKFIGRLIIAEHERSIESTKVIHGLIDTGA